MEFLRFKTSFSIPIQVMRSKVNYTEGKQASGIQYILLVLINKRSADNEYREKAGSAKKKTK